MDTGYETDFYSWAMTLSVSLRAGRLERHLADDPGLTASLIEATAQAHRLARLGAARETGRELA